MKCYILTLLAFILYVMNGYSQRVITGTVTDSSKATPLSGVSVHLKSSEATGTSTNDKGAFTISARSSDTLVFSSVGYITVEVPVGNRTIINVRLRAEFSDLDDVVVVAFGKQKKKEVVGSVTTVKPGDLKIPVSNLTTALAGKVAGIIAYQRSGEPGADNADFFIRGVTSFGYKVDPLILIDNIEVTKTDLARLQVDDIASFSIMKDATATALYGARGANGVILITTKEGREGKATVSLRVENSFSSPTKNIELADPVTYMKLQNEAVLTRNSIDVLAPRPYSLEKIDNTIDKTDPIAYPSTDWQKTLLKNYAVNQRAFLNVSGGGKVARYYISGAFTQDNGILKTDKKNDFNSNANLKSYSLRSNINIKLTPTTDLVTRLSGNFDDYTGPIEGGVWVYRNIMRTSPTLFPAYYPSSIVNYTNHIMFGNYESGNYLNPYANLQKGYKDYSRSQMEAQLQITQNLSFVTPGLSARAMINTSRYSYFDVNRFYNPYYYSLAYYDRLSKKYDLRLLNENTGTVYLGYNEGDKQVSSALYGEVAVNYNRVFADKHSLGGMLVGIMRNKLVGNAGDLQSSLPFRNLGISGRATYVYDGRYSAEFNFGYNGTERFYENHRYGFFPSAGVAWTVSNEKFMDPIKDVISSLKLRATYGLVGNDEIGTPNDRFFYLSNVNMSDGGYSAKFGVNEGQYSRTGISLSRYPNIDISWETARKLNVGLQMTLFNNLNIEADFFTEDRTNILQNRSTIPTSMGLYAPVRANVGRATSSGIDANIEYTRNFSAETWMKVMGNFTYAKSKYKAYEEPASEPYLSRIGYSVKQEWGYIAERLFVDDAEVANSPKQNFGKYRGGDIKYRDINNDGQITTLDMVPIGYPTVPEIMCGFGVSAGYKSLDFSFFFQGSARSTFWIDNAATSPFINYNYTNENIDNPMTYPLLKTNQLLKAYADDHWSEDNRNLYALWPRLDYQYNTNNAQRSTWFMRNGSFLRLKQVEVGYSLPKRWMDKLHLSKTRVYVNGINLLTISSFKLWDVEMGGNGLGYPIQKVINGGLQISF